MNRKYKGKEITVLYDVNRCIHAAECVKRAGEVFDPQTKPWIKPDRAAPDKLAWVIRHCPTGALHYETDTAELAEQPDESNTFRTAANGPLFVRGRINIETGGGEKLLSDTRVALCRCGASNNKPFCDNSHLAVGFQDKGLAQAKENSVGRESLDSEQLSANDLTITPLPNASLAAHGHFVIVNDAGESVFIGNEAYLCRCGASANKPFCDGSHARVGFTGS